MTKPPKRPWHARTVEEAALRLKTNIVHGLVSAKPAWRRFLLQFQQPLIYILITFGTVTAALRDWVDAGVIFGIASPWLVSIASSC